MVGALVDRPIAQKAKAAAFQPFVFQTIGQSEAQGGLARDNSVSAPVILIRRKVVHRSALAPRASRGFAEQLRHAGVHVHADRQRVTMIPVGGDHVVIFSHQRNRPECNRLLANVEMQKTTHLPLVVIFQGRLLESPDAEHLRKEADFFSRPELCVDLRFCKVDWRRFIFGFAHENVVRFVLSTSATRASGWQTRKIPSDQFPMQ